MFILKFREQDCWIAPWDGDPGRTLIRESAKEFKSEAQAQKFAKKILKSCSFREFSLVVEPK